MAPRISGPGPVVTAGRMLCLSHVLEYRVLKRIREGAGARQTRPASWLAKEKGTTPNEVMPFGCA